MALHFTPTVRFSTAQAMAVALIVAGEVFASHGFDVWITSAIDGQHNPGSLHPKGLALDLRVKHVPSAAIRQQIADDLKARLAPQFDVIYGAAANHLDHIHVEYDP